MKAKEILKLAEVEIQERLKAFSQDYLELRMKKQVGQLKNPASMRVLRKNIARMKTILNQKKVANKTKVGVN